MPPVQVISLQQDFLYGILTDRDLEAACRMGCISAGEVIRHVGPRPEAKVFDMFKAEGLV